MGLTHLTVRIESLTRSGEAFEDEFLVGTGAIDCLGPANLLAKAGIVEEGKDVYELANGEVVEYPFRYARVTFMGSETVSKIILGTDKVEPILGVVALESTGIGIDPVSRTLKRMSAKPLKLNL